MQKASAACVPPKVPACKRQRQHIRANVSIHGGTPHPIHHPFEVAVLSSPGRCQRSQHTERLQQRCLLNDARRHPHFSNVQVESLSLSRALSLSRSLLLSLSLSHIFTHVHTHTHIYIERETYLAHAQPARIPKWSYLKCGCKVSHNDNVNKRKRHSGYFF